MTIEYIGNIYPLQSRFLVLEITCWLSKLLLIYKCTANTHVTSYVFIICGNEFCDSFADYRICYHLLDMFFHKLKYKFLYIFTVFQVYALNHIFKVSRKSSSVYLLTILSIYFLIFLVNLFFKELKFTDVYAIIIH